MVDHANDATEHTIKLQIPFEPDTVVVITVAGNSIGMRVFGAMPRSIEEMHGILEAAKGCVKPTEKRP